MIRIALALAALSATTTADTRDLDRALAGRTPGAPQNCLRSRGTFGPQVINDRILLYRDGARMWRNDLDAACPGLDTMATLVTEMRGGQLCRNDLFYALQRGGMGIPGPRCRLGKFVPWSREKH